jgi:hypothetical protein
MEEKPVRWRAFYLGLMVSLAVMIAFFYWLTVAFA